VISGEPGEMARPRTFDPAEALDQAMILFWERGYARVSIRDLTDALHLNRPSLYAAFGDKETLFLKALERYRALFLEPLLAAMRDAEPGLGAIAALFDHVRRAYTSNRRPPGCLFMNTLLEWTEDGPVSEVLGAWRAEIHFAVREAVAAAQRCGQIGRDKDVDALTAFIVSNLKATAIEARATKDPELIGKLTRQAMAAL
jgi:AcrR family transcriptional regulator